MIDNLELSTLWQHILPLYYYIIANPALHVSCQSVNAYPLSFGYLKKFYKYPFPFLVFFSQ